MAIGTPVDIGHNQVSSGTTLAITTTANILTGDFVLIVAMGGTASTQITSVTTDASGNVYTVPTAGSQTDSASFAFTPNAVALNSGATLTVNFGGAAGRHGIQAYRITGLVTSAAAVLDGAYKENGQLSQNSGSITGARLNQNSNITFAVVAGGSVDVVTGFAAGAGFTSLGGTASPCFMDIAYQISSGQTALTFSPSWTTAGQSRLSLLPSLRGVVSASHDYSGLLGVSS